MDYDIFIYRGHEGDWKWNDNKDSYVYKHWEDGEPDGGEAENCAFMHMDSGKWKDTACSDKMTFMCKADAVADLDGGDSLPTTPAGSEACRGWAGNWYEDPMSGMCYQVLEEALSWEEARQECEYRGGWRDGGNLVSINSLQEQTFVQSKFQTYLRHMTLISDCYHVSIPGSSGGSGCSPHRPV